MSNNRDTTSNCPQDKPPAVAAHDLVKVYGGTTRALDEVTCHVGCDEFLVVLGPSGAGKSTLLRCLNRLIEPTSGRVELAGEDITHVHGKRLRDVHGRVGMIFQQFNLVKRLSVLDNVLAGRLRFCGNPMWSALSLVRFFPERERELAYECLKKVHIEDLAFKRADQLSGGQQQRVAIARTLTQEPDVILADEPVASLDPASADIVMDTLLAIHEIQCIPVIVNLHQVELGRRYAKRIVGMSSGTIVFDGSVEKLTDDVLRTIYGVEFDTMGKRRQVAAKETTVPVAVAV